MMPTEEEELARAEFTLAWYLYKKGRSEAAERHLERAEKLSPRDWTIRRAELRIRGIDPMMSPEFADLVSEWFAAGRTDRARSRKVEALTHPYRSSR
jgi:tetratricopeptide (TPR) repeat protein